MVPLVTALVMLLCCVPALGAETAVSQTAPAGEGWLVPQKNPAHGYGDMVGFWCEAAADTVSEAGVMQGYTDGTFGPGSALTNAQIAAVCARLCGLLTGGDGTVPHLYDEAWYQDNYAYLDSVLGEDYALRMETPEEACRRGIFVSALSAVLEAAKVSLPEINSVSVIPDQLDFDGSALAFYRAGILCGTDSYGTLDADGTLNRGQAAAMLARVIDPAQRLTFTLDSFDLCRDVLKMDPETVLLTVEGTPVTAAQFAPQLVTSLLQWGARGTGWAREDAVRIYLTYTACFFTLAVAKGVTLTDAQLSQTAQFGADSAGALGAAAAYWETMEQKNLLSMALSDYYITLGDKYGEADKMSALESEAQRLTATKSDALKGLDLSAVLARAAASPFSRW